jgi:hypothetical protein
MLVSYSAHCYDNFSYNYITPAGFFKYINIRGANDIPFDTKILKIPASPATLHHEILDNLPADIKYIGIETPAMVHVNYIPFGCKWIYIRKLKGCEITDYFPLNLIPISDEFGVFDEHRIRNCGWCFKISICKCSHPEYHIYNPMMLHEKNIQIAYKINKHFDYKANIPGIVPCCVLYESDKYI